MPRLDGSARGVFPISATPFTDNGEIDWESADRLTEFDLQCGVHGLTLLGVMGEAQKLTLDEASSFAGLTSVDEVRPGTRRLEPAGSIPARHQHK